MARARTYILVPVDADTVIAGAREVKNQLAVELGRCGLGAEVQVIETGTFGTMGQGVIVAVQPDGILYGNVKPADVPELVAEHLLKGRPCKRLIIPGQAPQPAAADSRHTQHLGRVVLDNCGRINPDSIEEYIANDGYFALAKALGEMTPEQVIEEVKASGLRGRGGAGFPTGVKWGMCAPVKGKVKYVICNADEGEPGTFKDRLIMEGDPHKVIEGMVICGYAIGASKGFIYIRGEYKLSIERLQKALTAARAQRLLGRKIFGSRYSFDIEIKLGAGAYICGEETALIESMEGKRGLPRLKPPYPAQCGYLGKPTNVNNVETLANVPAIIRKGAAWYRGIGTESTPGTKVYTILGHINRPGLIEVPAGVTLREIVNDYGGGMKGGRFKMAQLGGTAGDILGAEMLDVPLDYSAMQKVGHVLGSGAILIMNESVGVNEFLHASMRFFLHETCGSCNPCRNGMKVLYDITGRLKTKAGYPGDVALIEEVSMVLKTAAFCPLGQSPAGPIMSALRYFRPEIEAGMNPATPRPDSEHILRELVELKAL